MKRKPITSSSASKKAKTTNTEQQPIIISSQDSNNEESNNDQYYDPDTIFLLDSNGEFVIIPDDQEPISSEETEETNLLVSSSQSPPFDYSIYTSIDQFLIIPTHNLIKEIPHEIIANWMFYMDKQTLFNFIRVSREVYNIFDEIYAESVERLRLEILNNKRKSSDLNRLLDLFSNESRERSGEKVMLTYDDYFRMRSFTPWPLSYFHDRTRFESVVNENDPQIKVINEKADEQMARLLEMNNEQMNKETAQYEKVLPYGVFPRKDIYYLTFNQLVKRKCVKNLKEDLYMYTDQAYKIERVITSDLYANEEKKYSVDYHTYVDKHSHPTTVYIERIVRFFKHPNEMTFSDFDNRFKNNFLSELARILVYDCVFEYNKSTKTRERFVVSGGSLLHTLTGCGCQDIDIFIINNQEPDEIVNQAIKQVLLKFEEKTSNFTYNIMGSKTTINICEERPKMSIANGYRVETNQNIQIVLLRYDSIEELLLFFDLDCCKLAFDGIRVYTVLECLRSLKYKINFLPKRTGNTEINRARALKYGFRGFFTFTLDTDHPLSHAMHCDFVVEKLRKKITTEYKETRIDDIYNGRRNPTTQFFVQPKDFSFAAPMKESSDLDESNYLYPLILRNVDYHFVDLCKSIGLGAALWKLKKNISRERSCYIFDFLLDGDTKSKALFTSELKLENSERKGGSEMLEKLISLDGYTFLDRPSELFKNLQQDYNLVKNKYSYSHLVQKYNIVNCAKCSNYIYSTQIASQLRLKKRQHDSSIEIPKFDTINENNFNPEIHFCCDSCLRKVNGMIKFRAFIQSTSYGVSGAEKGIVTLLVEQDQNSGISKRKIFIYLEGAYGLEELQIAFYSLLNYRKYIEYISVDDEIHVKLANTTIVSSDYEVLYPPKTYPPKFDWMFNGSIVEKYLNTRLDKNRLELAADITEHFITVSQHELNLSMSIRNDILTRWEQIEERNKNVIDDDLIACPIDLFSRAQDVIFIEMKQDNFSRFVDSDIFKKFLIRELKKNDHILESLGTCKFNSRTGSLGSLSSEDLMNNLTPVSSSISSSPLHAISHSQPNNSSFSGNVNLTPRSSQDSESDSLDEKIATFYEKQNDSNESLLLPIIDDMSPYITPKDYDLGMKLVNSLNDSNMWKTIDEKVGLKTLVSNPVFSFSPRKSESGKIIVCNSGILTGKPRDWLNLLFSDSINKMIHEKMKKRFQVDYIKINPKNGAHYPNTIVYTEAQFPFPLTNRDFIFCRSVIPDLYNETTGEYDRYVFIQKPTQHHEYPARNSPIRALHYIFYIVEKKTQSSVKYSVFETGDLSGKIPPKIVSSFFKTIANAMHKKVIKACEKIYNEEIVSKDADGALSTLTEMLKYLEHERANKSNSTIAEKH
ncbi:predicted protein [Naegleria gruberi]|uniref:Predicted protein n=1 Tax=Naegleria gruberi TaxID=5762 RepID=D2VAV2_NAEGR|nr:uncharacterized protein NAEGRDRAFT_48052 [Naegleria gruberi]EFC46013.1 predicted protein [Naegleria gruberi]|eukprot:XP_002678757.1 predicted protein [Naegleria gruberi strain NEG-M]